MINFKELLKDGNDYLIKNQNNANLKLKNIFLNNNYNFKNENIITETFKSDNNF